MTTELKIGILTYLSEVEEKISQTHCVPPHCGQLTVISPSGISDIGTSWFAVLGKSFTA